MVFGETDQDGVAEEMMDLSDLPTALFACSVHDAVFEEDLQRVRGSGPTAWVTLGCCTSVVWCLFESSCWMCHHIQDSKPSDEQQVHDVTCSSRSPLVTQICTSCCCCLFAVWIINMARTESPSSPCNLSLCSVIHVCFIDVETASECTSTPLDIQKLSLKAPQEYLRSLVTVFYLNLFIYCSLIQLHHPPSFIRHHSTSTQSISLPR